MSEISKPHSRVADGQFVLEFIQNAYMERSADERVAAQEALMRVLNAPVVEAWQFDAKVDELRSLEEQLEAAQSVLREIGSTYDGVTPIFRKTGPKMLGANAFTYAPDICEALNVARRWPVAYPASRPES